MPRNAAQTRHFQEPRRLQRLKRGEAEDLCCPPLHPMHRALLARVAPLPEPVIKPLPLAARTGIALTGAIGAWALVAGVAWNIIGVL